MWSWSLKLELSRVSRLFHASVTKFRKQTGYYGLRISCCHDFISSRALSISVHSPTQVPQMKPIVTLINEMPNLNIRDDLKFPHRVCGSNSTRFFSPYVTERTRNDFQQKRLEDNLQHPGCHLRNASHFGACWWSRRALCVFQFDFRPLLASGPCK